MVRSGFRNQLLMLLLFALSFPPSVFGEQVGDSANPSRGLAAQVPASTKDGHISYPLRDFSFGIPEEGGLVGWDSRSFAPGNWKVVASRARSGQSSAAVSCGPDEQESTARLSSLPFAVSRGDVVSVAMAVDADGASQTTLRIGLQSEPQSGWSELLPYRVVKQRDIKRRVFFVIPPEVAAVRLVIEAQKRETKDVTWYVDDIEAKIVSLREYAANMTGSRRLPDIALLVPDALRQDNLACYGNQKCDTAYIDRLASEGTLYTEATSAAGWTKPSFGSIFTGLYPSQHTAERAKSVLPDEMLTLAEHLRENGYFTAGFMFSDPGAYVSREMNFNQGFDVYFQSGSQDEVSRALRTFLETNAETLSDLKGGGLFLVFHAMHSHGPYLNRVPNMITNTGPLGNVDITARDVILPVARGELKLTDEDYRYYRDVVAWQAGTYTDRVMGEVFNRLRWIGLYDDINIIFLSDHGEALGESWKGRQLWGHPLSFETVVRVPFILRVPGRVERGRVDHQRLVSSLDVFPTICDIAGILPPEDLEGYSLLAPRGLTKPAGSRQYAISEGWWKGYLTLRGGRFKLVARRAEARTTDAPFGWLIGTKDSPTRYELYDLVEDPTEIHDIAKERPDVLERLKNALLQHCRHVGRLSGSSGGVSSTKEIPDETLRLLEALGYLE